MPIVKGRPRVGTNHNDELSLFCFLTLEIQQPKDSSKRLLLESEILSVQGAEHGGLRVSSKWVESMVTNSRYSWHKAFSIAAISSHHQPWRLELLDQILEISARVG